MGETILDLVKQERARRQASSHYVIWVGEPFLRDEAAVEAEIEAARRDGKIGPGTRIVRASWKGAFAAVTGIVRKSVVIDYAPRPHFDAFHKRRHRWACMVCHRRAGKTIAATNDLVRRAFVENKADGRYGFVAPFRQQAKDIAWTYLKRFAASLLAGGDNAIRESDLSVQLVGGQIIRIYGADNSDAIRGAYFDGVVLDEFADMRSTLWSEVVRPMLADRQGWATFIGTPKGKNAFWQLWADALKNPEEWFTLMLKASQSKLLPQAELDAMAADMGPDQYAQELECSFEAAIKGAFYAEEMRVMLAEGRVCPIEISKDVRVHTAWDLGRRDSTAIWFIQCVGRERRLVDYYESSGVSLKHYVDILWEKKRLYGWQYGEHYLPHDVKVTELTSDDSRLRTLEKYGLTDIYVVPRHNDLDGINAVRKVLSRTWIDPTRCERGLEALRQYHREWDDVRKDFRDAPYHNWSSHAADALRYFAAGYDGQVSTKGASDHKRDESAPRASHWAM